MSVYVWKAMDLTGAKATGEVDADTKQAVADQLKARGLIVLDISDKHSSKEINLGFLKRIKPTDLTIMVRQLSTMVGAGLALATRLAYHPEGNATVINPPMRVNAHQVKR